MPDRPMCSWCGWRPAEVKGLCRTDYHYQWRTGRSRPSAKVVAHLDRVIERELRERS